jgi:hypothetical protein
VKDAVDCTRHGGFEERERADEGEERQRQTEPGCDLLGLEDGHHERDDAKHDEQFADAHEQAVPQAGPQSALRRDCSGATEEAGDEHVRRDGEDGHGARGDDYTHSGGDPPPVRHRGDRGGTTP